MPPITELTRIELIHRERLARQGGFTTGLLPVASETPTRRQTLADQVDASRSAEHDLFTFAGFDGLGAVLRVDLDTFGAAIARTVGRPQVAPPTDLVVETWWEQARTLHDE